MSSTNLGDFYADPLSEIFSNLAFEDLLSSYTVNKHWQKTLQGVIYKRITEGALESYALNELGNLGKSYPFINIFLIREIHQRLQHNYLRDFLQEFPNANWNYFKLSDNPNITMSDVLARPNANWNYINLSVNPNITMNYVLAHPNANWDYNTLSINSNITLLDVLNNPDLPWSYKELNKNANVTLADVLTYSNIKWRYQDLSVNPNIIPSDVLVKPDMDWNIRLLMENPNTKFTDIIEYPTIKWDYSWLSLMRNVTLADILANPNDIMHFYVLSDNADITLADVLAHPEISWDYTVLTINPNITITDILAHPELRWNYKWLNFNPNLKITDILAHPDLPWNFDMISHNEFTKNARYRDLAQKIIRSLLPEKIPVFINGQKHLLSPEEVYGLVLGLTVTNKLESNPVKFYDITLDLATAKMFFSTPIRETKYLVYIQDKPYHFQDLAFLSALKSTGVPLTKFYDKSKNYLKLNIK